MLSYIAFPNIVFNNGIAFPSSAPPNKQILCSAYTTFALSRYFKTVNLTRKLQYVLT